MYPNIKCQTSTMQKPQPLLHQPNIYIPLGIENYMKIFASFMRKTGIILMFLSLIINEVELFI